jgi:alkaline phosphatase
MLLTGEGKPPLVNIMSCYYNRHSDMKMLIRNILLGLILFGGICGCSSPAKQTSSCAHHTGPKNVIIMIADGGGFNHYKSADYYDCGRSPCQPYEDFPVRLAMSTYPYGGSYDPNLAWASFDYVDKGATDSAAAATAMATGIKTYNAAIGVDVHKKPVLNLVERAEQLGKSTGVVTSVPFSHATPAGFTVHNPYRDDYHGIARQMIFDSNPRVIMGCGNPDYDSNGSQTANPNYKYINSSAWVVLKSGSAGGDADGIPDHWKLIQTRAEFQLLANGETPRRVFGVPQVFETLQQGRKGNAYIAPYTVPFTQTVPTLEEMTKAALNVLDDDPNGFFVMIEGGAVDWAAHNNQSGRLIEEMNDFNKSIEAVIRWIDTNSRWNETLVIITADHETGHLTGPGSGQTWNDIISNGPGKLPAMEWHSKNHTNSLVPFFAKGPGAEKFTETIDGNDPVRGPYIDNTDIANTIFALWLTK